MVYNINKKIEGEKNMKIMDGIFAYLAWLFAIFFISVLLYTFGEINGYNKGILKIQQNAITAGVAIWVADKDGKPEFKFIDKFVENNELKQLQ